MKVFYCIYQDDDDVNGDNLRSVNIKEVQLLVDRILQKPENFIGFVDKTKTTIQFFLETDGIVIIDIPDMQKGGSYSKEITPIEMREIINNLQEPYTNYITKLNLQFNPFNKEDWIDE